MLYDIAKVWEMQNLRENTYTYPGGEIYENNSVTRPFYPTPTSQLVRYTHTLTVPNPLLLYGPGSERVKQNQTPLSFTAKEAAILASDQLPWCHT